MKNAEICVWRRSADSEVVLWRLAPRHWRVVFYWLMFSPPASRAPATVEVVRKLRGYLWMNCHARLDCRGAPGRPSQRDRVRRNG